MSAIEQAVLFQPCGDAFTFGAIPLKQVFDVAQAEDLPALAIDWGPWGEAGMAARMGERFAAMGLQLIPPPLGLDILGRLLGRALPESCLPTLRRLFLRRWTHMLSPKRSHSGDETT